MHHGHRAPQDPKKEKHQGSQSKLNGNADLNLSGAIYLPGDKLDVQGGTSANMSCLQVIAYEIRITGNAAVAGTCDQNSGTDKLIRSTVELVE